MSEIITVNTDHIQGVEAGNDLYQNRENLYSLYQKDDAPRASICVQGYNRLEKTKYCVECVLKYTKDVDFELILVDNGSTDDTLAYFQSVAYEKKQILHITKNISSAYPLNEIKRIYRGNFLILLPNDVYVTKNWLSNLLLCMDSDPRIGFVMPVSSNVSNLQEMDLGYRNMEEMQYKAALYNKSDPKKWEERMRLVNVISIYKREFIDVIGMPDFGFMHDFSEDDLAMRIRRAGYKLILCKDTFVCHDHDFRNMEDKDPVKFHNSLKAGRKNFKDKYYGLDAWDDISNFESLTLNMIDRADFIPGNPRALAIDVRCGTPVLEIRNHLRKRKINNVYTSAFTTEAKYYTDLLTAADEVTCDRIAFIQEHYLNNSFHIILLGEPVNTYHNPISLLQTLLNLLKPKGILLFHVRNTNDIRQFLRTLGLAQLTDPDYPSLLPLDELEQCLKLLGVSNIQSVQELQSYSKEDIEMMQNLVENLKLPQKEEIMNRLQTRDFHYCVTK